MTAPGLMWDACCALTLAATRREAEIMHALGRPCYLVREVLTHEVLALRPLPEEDPSGALVAVDLSPLSDAGLLQIVTLTSAEQTSFIRFAAQVDDGEARTAAAALHRGFAVATDDRDAIRLLGSLSPVVEVWTTADWLKAWADAESIAPDVLRGVLRRVEICARYWPRRAHPLHGWWRNCLPGS